MRRPFGVAAIALLSGVLLFLAIAVAPSHATVPGTNGLIVFQRIVGTPSKTCDPCTQVFTIRADGAVPARSRGAGRAARTLPGLPTASAS